MFKDVSQDQLHAFLFVFNFLKSRRLVCLLLLQSILIFKYSSCKWFASAIIRRQRLNCYSEICFFECFWYETKIMPLMCNNMACDKWNRFLSLFSDVSLWYFRTRSILFELTIILAIQHHFSSRLIQREKKCSNSIFLLDFINDLKQTNSFFSCILTTYGDLSRRKYVEIELKRLVDYESALQIFSSSRWELWIANQRFLPYLLRLSFVQRTAFGQCWPYANDDSLSRIQIKNARLTAAWKRVFSRCVGVLERRGRKVTVEKVSSSWDSVFLRASGDCIGGVGKTG